MNKPSSFNLVIPKTVNNSKLILFLILSSLINLQCSIMPEHCTLVSFLYKILLEFVYLLVYLSKLYFNKPKYASLISKQSNLYFKNEHHIFTYDHHISIFLYTTHILNWYFYSLYKFNSLFNKLYNVSIESHLSSSAALCVKCVVVKDSRYISCRSLCTLDPF